MILPALSVKLPYAKWLADGSKSIETRVWATRYRGPLVICAGLSVLDDAYRMSPLRGKGLCVRWLRNCRPMTREDEPTARCEVYDQAVSWVFQERVIPLNYPEIRGQQGVFAACVPEGSFFCPEERNEAYRWLEWARGKGLLDLVQKPKPQAGFTT